jgi:hypothetical protein
MPNYRKWAHQAATEVGVDPKLFSSLVGAESAFNPRARSPVGAEGFTQLMPGTAHGLSKKYGIDTSTPYGNLLGGAYYLKEQIDRFGDLRKAVAAYNAGPGAVEKYGGVPPYTETKNYVRRVLGGAGVSKHTSSFSMPPSAMPDPGPAAPASSREGLRGALIQNLADIGAHGGHVDPLAMLQGISAGVQQDRRSTPLLAPSTVSSSPTPAAAFRGGKVVLRQGANRAGVALAPDILDFAHHVSAIFGQPLTIGTGTNHNRYVLGSRRQSAHWTGHAVDIPATGRALIAMGRAALIAAGMDPARANKSNGGLYNIGGRQIIFGVSGTANGGDHTNHLHLGVRG